MWNPRILPVRPLSTADAVPIGLEAIEGPPTSARGSKDLVLRGGKHQGNNVKKRVEAEAAELGYTWEIVERAKKGLGGDFHKLWKYLEGTGQQLFMKHAKGGSRGNNLHIRPGYEMAGALGDDPALG